MPTACPEVKLAARGYSERVLGQWNAALCVSRHGEHYADAVANVHGTREQCIGQRPVRVVLQQRMNLHVRRMGLANALVQALCNDGGEGLVGGELVVGVHGDDGLEAAGLLDEGDESIGRDLRVRLRANATGFSRMTDSSRKECETVSARISRERCTPGQCWK